MTYHVPHLFLHHHPALHGIILYMREKGVNVNTAFLGIIIAILGFGGKELYSEMRQSHDSMIEMKKDLIMIRTEMVQKTEYEVEITALKARLGANEVRQSQIEIEIQKLKKP